MKSSSAVSSGVKKNDSELSVTLEHYGTHRARTDSRIQWPWSCPSSGSIWKGKEFGFGWDSLCALRKTKTRQLVRAIMPSDISIWGLDNCEDWNKER
jgi:hypothetical protein